MLKKAARQADALAKLLPDTDPDKATTRAAIARLGNECGCAMGGVFLVGACLLIATSAAISRDFGMLRLALGVLLVFLASVLGKLTGVLIAVARLALISRRLRGQVLTVGDPASHTAAVSSEA